MVHSADAGRASDRAGLPVRSREPLDDGLETAAHAAAGRAAGSNLAPMRRAAVLTIALLLCALAGVAVAGTRHLSASESDGLAFSASKITVRHGKVKLVMKNPSGNHLQHSIDISGRGIAKHGKIVDPGGTSTVSAKLHRGTYTFYCRVSGHRAEGMKGKLVVR
jgi:uncharacterized cupredoxin-like copper-binding protein